MIKETVLITGCTGFTGSYLLNFMLTRGHRVYCLSRAKDGYSKDQRIFDVLRFWGGGKEKRYLKNLIILNGDVTKNNLGLSKAAIAKLKAEVSQIFHLAAVTKFNAPENMLRQVNVQGTNNVLNLARFLSNSGCLKKVNHLSTIYICGDYRGVFTETKLDVGQKFDIPYEKTKFEAEKNVGKYRKNGLWVDVFRVPAIVGESSSGKILFLNNAFYQGLRILNSEMFDFLPCRGSSINVVFVDDLCEGLYAISFNTKQRNRNYHLFNNKPLFIEDFLSLACKYFRTQKPKFIKFADAANMPMSSVQKRMLSYNYSFFNRGARFDSRKTSGHLRKLEFLFNDSKEKSLLNLLRYVEEVGFLKKRNTI